jgi:hypothetical protein
MKDKYIFIFTILCHDLFICCILGAGYFGCTGKLPWVGTYSDIRDQRYRTELDIGPSNIGLKREESDIISDIGTNCSDIPYPTYFIP